MRERHVLGGVASVPTFNRGIADHQYLFVNGRPVKDRLLMGAIRVAYAEMLPRDRHAVVALFLDVPPGEVDINVHPAKTEVRFRDPQLVRGLIVSGLRRALDDAGLRVVRHTPVDLAQHWTSEPPGASPSGDGLAWGTHPTADLPDAYPSIGGKGPLFHEARPTFFSAPPQARAEPAWTPPAPQADHPLGVARGQVAKTYIVAETQDGLILVDQHAAHERLVLERMRAALKGGRVAAQALLIPEVRRTRRIRLRPA